MNNNQLMQKIFITFSRIVFVSGLLVVLMGMFIGGMIFALNSKNSEQILTKKISGSGVVLAEQKLLGNDGNNESMVDKVILDDARPLLIKRYLEKYKSPLLPYADLILKLSDTYGIKYYWILAIGQQESNLCKKIPENSHNCWGYGINSAGTLRFDSYELALNSYTQYLKREYFDKGYDTPEKIMKKYCPYSNGSWAYGVSHFINEIEKGTF